MALELGEVSLEWVDERDRAKFPAVVVVGVKDASLVGTTAAWELDVEVSYVSCGHVVGVMCTVWVMAGFGPEQRDAMLAAVLRRAAAWNIGLVRIFEVRPPRIEAARRF